MTTATARVHRGVESLERLDTAPSYAPSGDWVEGALHRGLQETLIERINQYGHDTATTSARPRRPRLAQSARVTH